MKQTRGWICCMSCMAVRLYWDCHNMSLEGVEAGWASSKAAGKSGQAPDGADSRECKNVCRVLGKW